MRLVIDDINYDGRRWRSARVSGHGKRIPAIRIPIYTRRLSAPVQARQCLGELGGSLLRVARPDTIT
jgi:hypothetical protein